MTSQPRKQIISIHWSNTSKSEDNQTCKFDQLIEYSMIAIFFEKSFTKCGGETIPRPCSKKLNLSISLD